MTPLYPGATTALLYPEATWQPAIVPRQIIVHTNGGPQTSTPAQLRAYMLQPSVDLECHIALGFRGAGDALQLVPFDVRADCNAAANRYQVPGDPTWYGAVSVECQDHGYLNNPTDQDPWTPEQCAWLVEFFRWARVELGIPTQRCTAWNGPGIGAHVDFPSWSAAAHSCPGKARRAQLPDLIIEAAGNEPPPPSPEESVLAYFRDDRATGWQIWVVATDAIGNAWTCPISDLPDHGKWDKVQPILGDPPVKPFGALIGLMDAQNRPTPLPALPPPSNDIVKEHSHLGGVTGPTGGVIR